MCQQKYRTESQKEDWKLYSHYCFLPHRKRGRGISKRGLKAWAEERRVHRRDLFKNLKKRIERLNGLNADVEVAGRKESQKEDWKFTIKSATSESIAVKRISKRGLKDRVPVAEFQIHAVSDPESQKEDWKAVHCAWRYMYTYRTRESQKEDWKLSSATVAISCATFCRESQKEDWKCDVLKSP